MNKDDEQHNVGSIDFDPSTIVNRCSGEVHFTIDIGPGFAYQCLPLESENAEQARHGGFIRVHKLVDVMAECPGWDVALPKVYRLLCCHKLRGACPTTDGRDPRSVWYGIMKAVMCDIEQDWAEIDSAVTPPQSLQPHEYVEGQFIPAGRKSGYDFAQQFVKLDEFRDYVEHMAKTLRIPLPLPAELFPAELDSAGDVPSPHIDSELAGKSPVGTNVGAAKRYLPQNRQGVCTTPTGTMRGNLWKAFVSSLGS